MAGACFCALCRPGAAVALPAARYCRQLAGGVEVTAGGMRWVRAAVSMVIWSAWPGCRFVVTPLAGLAAIANGE